MAHAQHERTYSPVVPHEVLEVDGSNLQHVVIEPGSGHQLNDDRRKARLRLDALHEILSCMQDDLIVNFVIYQKNCVLSKAMRPRCGTNQPYAACDPATTISRRPSQAGEVYHLKPAKTRESWTLVSIITCPPLRVQSMARPIVA